MYVSDYFTQHDFVASLGAAAGAKYSTRCNHESAIRVQSVREPRRTVGVGIYYVMFVIPLIALSTGPTRLTGMTHSLRQLTLLYLYFAFAILSNDSMFLRWDLRVWKWPMCLWCGNYSVNFCRIRYLWIPGPGMGERLFTPEPNPTAPPSEDPSGLLRIPQVLRRM